MSVNLLSTSKRLPALLSLSVVALLLTACNDRVGLAQQALEQIREQSAQPIEPPPTTELIEDFVYSANNLRSPFLPPSLVNIQTPTASLDGVRPDITRSKEALEQYEISQLTFRGMVVSSKGQQYALIQRPDGSIASAKVGDYLGLNDGRIVEITATQVNLIEIVPDSRVGFVESPQSLIAPIS
jgi:type IV pilus assembly protein PilP